MCPFGIITLAESWIKEQDIAKYKQEEYSSIIMARRDKRRSGGVAVYVKNAVNWTGLKINIGTANCITNTLIRELGTQHSVDVLAVYKDCNSDKTLYIN